MDADFWHQKWANNDIAFHEKSANALLVRHFPALGLEKGGRVFLPLCGKSLDIHWLLKQGYQVVGAELSRLAVEQLFEELGVQPTVSLCGASERFSAESLDVFVGDIFELSPAHVGAVDVIYDRAALVALPEEMRARYASHLMELTGNAAQLLICFDYDQSLLAGPPFSVSGDELRRHYGGAYQLKQLERVELPGGLKGKVAATECVWLLERV